MNICKDKPYIRLCIIIIVILVLIVFFLIDNSTQFFRRFINVLNNNMTFSDFLREYNFRAHIDYFMAWVFAPFQFLMIPLVPVSGVFLFNRLNSTFKFEAVRSEDRFRFFFKKSLSYSLYIAITIYVMYLIFYLFAIIFCGVENGSGIIYRTLFVDILGRDFYFDHRFIYYFIEGTARFFVIPFIYSFLSCSIVYYVKNRYMAYFLPLFYWFGLIAVGFVFFFFFPKISYYFSPSAILATSSYEVNTFFVFLPHLLVLVLSIYLIYRAVIKYEL